MRSPWVDLLLLHGHLTPTALSWRPDALACEHPPRSVEVDVAQLPLQQQAGRELDCPG
jgi:hypothetical protein